MSFDVAKENPLFRKSSMLAKIKTRIRRLPVQGEALVAAKKMQKIVGMNSNRSISKNEICNNDLKSIGVLDTADRN
jgi:hypothetical protein